MLLSAMSMHRRTRPRSEAIHPDFDFVACENVQACSGYFHPGTAE